MQSRDQTLLHQVRERLDQAQAEVERLCAELESGDPRLYQALEGTLALAVRALEKARAHLVWLDRS
jgi:hypothetical protein